MKTYNKLFVLCLILGLIFAGCTTTSPLQKPSTQPEIIYDEAGRPLWVPAPDNRPSQKDKQPASHEVGQKPESHQEVDEYNEQSNEEASEQKKPIAGIGVNDDITPVPEDSHLLAAVMPLADQAEQQIKMGQLDQAFATAERAVRIDPHNAKLWNLMARIQFKQKNYFQAEQLAKKSNLLASGDRSLQALNWKLIAAVLSQRGEEDQAQQAFQKAQQLESQ